MRGPVKLLKRTEQCDWFDNGYFVPTDKTPRPFRKLAYVMDKGGEKLMTITGIPISAAIGTPDWMQVQFANRTLYTNEWVRLFRQLRMMGFTYVGISRADIAADAVEGDGGDFLRPIKSSWHGNGRYFGKGNWFPRMERNKLAGAAIGTPGSNKYLRVYNKSRELKRYPKEHITNAWESVGVSAETLGADIMRFEARVKGREARRYFEGESKFEWVEGLADPVRCAEVLESMTNKLFDFRTSTKYTRDAQPLSKWDWSYVTPGEIEAMAREPKTVDFTMHTKKVTIRALTILSMATSDRKFAEAADDIARASNLQDWQVKSTEQWTKDLVSMNSDPTSDALRLFDQLKL